MNLKISRVPVNNFITQSLCAGNVKEQYMTFQPRPHTEIWHLFTSLKINIEALTSSWLRYSVNAISKAKINVLWPYASWRNINSYLKWIWRARRFKVKWFGLPLAQVDLWEHGCCAGVAPSVIWKQLSNNRFRNSISSDKSNLQWWNHTICCQHSNASGTQSKRSTMGGAILMRISNTSSRGVSALPGNFLASN